MHVPLPLGDDARKSLDGQWAFELFDSPEAVPSRAVTGPTPTGTRTLAVPGNWTVQDVGDLPHYTNIQMPFPGPPPRLPAHNPTGVYRRSFTTGRGWKRHRIVLHVGGAESVHAVYLNDRFIGYGTDSRLPSEYDITDAVVSGSNHLAIVVARYSALSYVEDQDQWWMAGLHRSVHIEARTPVHIADVRCDADLEPATGTGVLQVVTEVGFAVEPTAGHSVRVTLRGPTGKQVGKPSVLPVPHAFAAPYVFEGFLTRHRFTVPGVQPWSAESPVRYTAEVQLLDAAGTVLQHTSQHIGFRHVEIRQRQLLVNGQPVWIFGVNRHDHHPERGKAVTVDDMRADLLTMRQHNITAVRTSHYPNDSAFYDLCDELGMYVVDEANIEATATPACATTALAGRGGPWQPDGRPQPPVHHPVELGQRRRVRREPRCARRLDPQHRPQPPAALRGRSAARRLARRPGQHRHRLPDVLHHRAHPRLRPRPCRHPPAHPVRVQPRDGQQQRLAGRLLGCHHVDAVAAGWLHLGVERPRPAHARCRWASAPRLWGHVWRHTQRFQLRHQSDSRSHREPSPVCWYAPLFCKVGAGTYG
jgi:hypothetical protein